MLPPLCPSPRLYRRLPTPRPLQRPLRHRPAVENTSRPGADPTDTSLGFENFCHTILVDRGLVCSVHTEKDLITLLQVIHEYNMAHPSEDQRVLVRVAAGTKNPPSNDQPADQHEEEQNADAIPYSSFSYSFSLTPCVLSHVVIRLVGDAFRSVQWANQGKLQVSVGPNLAIGELEDILWEQYNAMIPSTPLIPYVTLVGLMGNAGHGTGRDTGAVAGLLTSVRLIQLDGTPRTITNTDPAFPVITGAHLGAFGVITGVTIQCYPAKKFQSTKTPMCFYDLVQKAKEGMFLNESYTSVMYMPSYSANEFDAGGPLAVQVVVGQLVDTSVPDVNSDESKRRFGEFAMSAGVGFLDALELPFVLAEHPDLIPTMMKVIAAAEIGTEAEEQTGPFHTISHWASAFPWALDDIDVVVPCDDANTDTILEVLAGLQEQLTVSQKAGHYPIVDAVYLRFIKGTAGGMSTSQITPPTTASHHFLCFDVVSNLAIPGYLDFKKAMTVILIDDLHGKPHWGKTVDSDTDFQSMYGQQYTLFKAQVEAFAAAAGYSGWSSLPLVNPFLRMILSNEQMRPVEPVEPVVINHPVPHTMVNGVRVAKSKQQVDQCTVKLRDRVDDWMRTNQLGQHKTTAGSRTMAARSTGTPPHGVRQVAPDERIRNAAEHSKLQHQRRMRRSGLKAVGHTAGSVVSASPNVITDDTRAFADMEPQLQELLTKLNQRTGVTAVV